MALALVMIVGACPAFAATTSSTQTVQVTVNPTIAIAATWANGNNNSTIALGSLAADGLQTTFTGGLGGEQLFTYSNEPIDIYTKASGPLANGANNIALSNFLYSGGSTATPTAFTTNYFKMFGAWGAAPQTPGYNSTPINLYLTVPFGTVPTSYSTTVYFSAVNAGNLTAPTAP